jgi:hypothetical protein
VADNQVLTDAQAKVHTVKSNCIRAAKTVIAKELGITAPLSMVHFNVIQEDGDGFRWELIDQTPGPLLGKQPNAPEPEPNTQPTPAPEPQASADSAPAPENAPAARDPHHPPTKGALPIAVDAVKDAKMPPFGRDAKPVDLRPMRKIYPHKAGTKYGLLSALAARSQGLTLGEAYDVLTGPQAADWRRINIRPALLHKINRVAGYGVRQVDRTGAEFALEGRRYEALRLGMVDGEGPVMKKGPFYDEKATLPVFFLIIPEGAPAPHPIPAVEG